MIATITVNITIIIIIIMVNAECSNVQSLSKVWQIPPLAQLCSSIKTHLLPSDDEYKYKYKTDENTNTATAWLNKNSPALDDPDKYDDNHKL